MGEFSVFPVTSKEKTSHSFGSGFGEHMAAQWAGGNGRVPWLGCGAGGWVHVSLCDQAQSVGYGISVNPLLSEGKKKNKNHMNAPL